MDAMHGMLKQEGGVNKANLMGSEPKLTSSAPLEKGEDSDEPVWLVLTRAISAGSCFIDRPYCAASPQASHIGLPGPRSCEKRTTHQNLRLISPFSRTEPVRAEKGTGINYPAHLWYLIPSIPLIRLD